MLEEREEELKRGFFLSLIEKLRPKPKNYIHNRAGDRLGIIEEIKLEKVESVDKLIDKINKAKEDNTNYLIIERLDLLSQASLDLIEAESNLRILKGESVLIYFLPLVLKDLYKMLGEDLKSKELLVFSGSQDLTEEIILQLSKELKFITLVGDNDTIEAISKNVLEATGLAIFHSKNVDKILKNYHIIINLNEGTRLNISNTRREALIFDFTRRKALSYLNSHRIIEDLVFDMEGLDIEENTYLEKGLSSFLYEYFNAFKKEDIKGVLVNKKVYSLQDFIGAKIKQSGNL